MLDAICSAPGGSEYGQNKVTFRGCTTSASSDGMQEPSAAPFLYSSETRALLENIEAQKKEALASLSVRSLETLNRRAVPMHSRAAHLAPDVQITPLLFVLVLRHSTTSQWIEQYVRTRLPVDGVHHRIDCCVTSWGIYADVPGT